MRQNHPMIMNKAIKYFGKIIKLFFASPSIELASRWPSYLSVSAMRILNNIQLSTAQLRAISIIVKEKTPCRLLIFGVENDSVFWSRINKEGVTVFIENNKDWYQSITEMCNNIRVFLINYNTKRSDWKMLLDSPSLLDIALPDDVKKEKWDFMAHP